jgi:phospholipase/lecithinase/hemolysin
MHRTPDALDTFSPAERKHWARSITAYNRGIADILEDFKSLHPSTNIWLVDAWHVFNRILDNPTVCNVTSGIKEVRGWCPAYAAGRPEDEADCAFRVEEYFWWDSYHPSFVVHEALAGVVAKSLKAGPNVC